jgi:hypothetical protein
MKKNKKLDEKRVKVLYQNLAGVWYAFAEVGSEIFYTPVDYKTIQQSTPQTNPTTTAILGKKKRAPAKET